MAGGLGGIGRDICRWMASRKARYFILLSRSAKHDDLAKDLIDELRREGVTVMTPICDIADKAILKSVLRQYGQTMPPIKGCIQSTLALHVRSHPRAPYKLLLINAIGRAFRLYDPP